MAYFKNIHSLAELKKEYRRLALENHPDKGGSTEVMQQINVEFERLHEIWRTILPYRLMLLVMKTTMQEHQQKNILTSYITSIVGRVATTKDSTLLRLWNWCVTG